MIWISKLLIHTDLIFRVDFAIGYGMSVAEQNLKQLS